MRSTLRVEHLVWRGHGDCGEMELSFGAGSCRRWLSARSSRFLFASLYTISSLYRAVAASRSRLYEVVSPR